MTSLWRRIRGGKRAVPSLAVLAYHRVGRPEGARFDPWVFTADADQLEADIRYVKNRFRAVGLEEALAIAAGLERSPGMAVLFAFDDGYVDNYETAYPILKAHGVEAVFHLVTGFANGSALPWWDQIAWLVQSTRARSIRLRGAAFDLTGADRRETVKSVLEFFKSSAGQPLEAFLRELEAACGLERPTQAERMFLSWSEAREMHAGGMSIGAHTHTHPILARLSREEQTHELGGSKQTLETELGGPVDVVAYPVGARNDFTDVTKDVLRACGYRAAFSCYGGCNFSGRTEPFDIKRIPVYWGARPERLLA